MGHREMILLLGALVLFGLLMLSLNQYAMDQNDVIFEQELEFYAISLAQSFIEEAKTRAFDTTVINASPQLPSGFTSFGGLGPDGGETYPNFNDVDDFNNFTFQDSTGRAVFDVDIDVGYVESADPETGVNYETFYKNMTVTVDSPYMDWPVQLNYVFGYIQN